MKVIGITGGTGAGKTSALNVLKEFGACIVDCDEVYHELLKTNKEMQAELSERFQLDISKGFDRKELGRRVFGDEKALSDLNTITHKYVINETERRIESAAAEGIKIAAIDAILLIESGTGRLCDLTVAVTAPAEVRAKRIMERENISYDYAMLRIKAQKSDDFFRSNCDAVLINDCETLEEFEERCRSFFAGVLKEEE